MKFKVYDASEGRSEVFFRLQEDEDVAGRIVLIAADQNGDRLPQGDILVINKDGTIKMCPSVSEDFGLQLDRDGCVILK